MTAWRATCPKAALLLLGAIASGLVAFVDYQTGYIFNVALFYFFPILLVTWYAGRAAGIILAILSSLAWFIANAITAPPSLALGVHLWNSGMRLTVFVGAAWVLASLRRATERAALADIDHLTGTASARAFKEFARNEVVRSRRYGHPLTMVYVDVDGFKTINDTGGHAMGDNVLRQTAAVLVQNLRESDVVGRVGGDEFIILMPETGYEAADHTLRRLQGRLSAKMQENVWPITFSLGAATFAIPPQSVEDAVGAADRLMYQAKHVGGNTIRHEKIAEGGRLSCDAA